MGGEQLHRERREIHFKNHILPRSPHQDPSLTIQFSLPGRVMSKQESPPVAITSEEAEYVKTRFMELPVPEAMDFISRNFTGVNHYTKFLGIPAAVVRHDIVADQCFKAALVRMNEKQCRFWAEIICSASNQRDLARHAADVYNEMMIMGSLMAAHPMRMESRFQWYTKVMAHGYQHYYDFVRTRYDDNGELKEPYKSRAVEREKELMKKLVGVDDTEAEKETKLRQISLTLDQELSHMTLEQKGKMDTPPPTKEDLLEGNLSMVDMYEMETKLEADYIDSQ